MTTFVLLVATLALAPSLQPTPTDCRGPVSDVRTSDTLRAVPDIRVGTLDDSVQFVGPLLDLAVDSSGTIYAPVRRGQRVWVLQPDGTPLRTIGREGRGPGEFRSPTYVGLNGDTLWVGDTDLGRLTLFSRRGDVLETISFFRPTESSSLRPLTPERLLADGSMYSSPSATTGDPASAPPPDSTSGLRVSRSGNVRDTLLRRWKAHQTMYVDGLFGPGSGTVMQQPFADTDLSDVHAGGSYLVQVHRRVDEEEDGTPTFCVRKIGPAGDTAFARRYGYQPEPLEEEAVERYLATTLTAMRMTARRNPNFELREGRVRDAVLEVLHRPAHHPPVSDVLAARDGSVWLQREPTSEKRTILTVLEPDGEPRTTVAVPVAPADVRLLEADGDRLWAQVTSDAGVWTLVRFGLR